LDKLLHGEEFGDALEQRQDGDMRQVHASLDLPGFIPELAAAVGLFVAVVVALCCIGVAPVYTGVHYPGDILVGVLCDIVRNVFAMAQD
jgi:hypothetical protein